MLYIASDHAGFELKAAIIKHLADKNIQVVDLGPKTLSPTDDYPVYVAELAKKLKTNSTTQKGIIICRNGVGVSMMANKYPWIRAALSWSSDHAKSSRVDDNTNVLALPSDYITKSIALKIVETWLNTNFSNEARHIRRLGELEELTRSL